MVLILFIFNDNDVITYGVFFSLIIISTELFTLRVNASQARLLFEYKFSKNLILKTAFYYSIISFSFFYLITFIFFKNLLQEDLILIAFYFYSIFKIINNFCVLNFKIFGEQFHYLYFTLGEFIIFCSGLILIYTFSDITFLNFICIATLSLIFSSIYCIIKNKFLAKKIKNIFNKKIFTYFYVHSIKITLYSIAYFIVIHHARVLGKYFIELNDYSLYIKITTVLLLISMFSKLLFDVYRPELSLINSSKFNDKQALLKSKKIISNVYRLSILFITFFFLLLFTAINYFNYEFIALNTLLFCYIYLLFDMSISARLTRIVYRGMWSRLILSYLPASIISFASSYFLYNYYGLNGLLMSSILLFSVIYLTSFFLIKR